MSRKNRRCRKTGKVYYKDRIAAEMVVLSRSRSDQTRDRTEIRVYSCNFCPGYHTTSRPFDPTRRRPRNRAG